MPILYFEHRKDKLLFSPQYTRVRHRYRGPRESYKNNLEQSQIRFTIHKLYKAFNDFRADFLAKHADLYGGIVFEEGIFPGDQLYPGATTYPNEDFRLSSIDDLTMRLQDLQSRVRALEGK